MTRYAEDSDVFTGRWVRHGLILRAEAPSRAQQQSLRREPDVLRCALADERDAQRARLAEAGQRAQWALIEAAAVAFAVHPALIFARNRTTAVAQARQVAAWLLRDAGMSLPAIGRALLRDHTTIGYAVRAVDQAPELLSVARRLAAREVAA